MGYEAADEDVARRLAPHDPATADELWISYHPATGELDLTAWQELLVAHADWTVADDGTATTDAELLRRIAVCGKAVREFAG